MRKWRKMFAAACAGVICAVGMPLTGMSEYLPEVGIMASAEDSYTYDVFTYAYLDDGTIQITDCDAENLDVKIPREINGAAVTKVKFKSWWFHATSIAIPDTVKNIEINVWTNTSIIENITVSKDNTAYSSEDGVLFDKNKTTLICYPTRKSETSYQIPNSVTSISNSAFWCCKSLESVVIPDRVTSIGEYAFYGTPWMEKRQAEDPLVTVNGILIDGTTCSGDVIIPGSVTSIANDAFRNCKNLKSVVIGGSVTSIGLGAFYECVSLESVTIGGGVTTIRSYAFNGCEALADVYFNGTPSEWNAIEKGSNNEPLLSAAMHYIYNDLVYVVSEDGTIEITDCDESVTRVGIPAEIDGIPVADIGENAFENCTALTNIVIPDSVTSIGGGAFHNCNSLTDVYYNGTEEEWNAITIDNGDGYNDPLLLATIHFSSGLDTGDLDNDGKITMTDAYQALIASSKVALGEDDGLTAVQFMAADVDGSGRLTMMDAYWILMYSSYSYIGEEITWEELLK